MARKSATRPQYEEERRSTRALFKNVTKPEITNLIREWFKTNGEPPRVIDWDPSFAIRVGRPELAERFYEEGCWPLAATVVGMYGTFTAAVIDAGFYPRARTKAWEGMDVESRSDYLRTAIDAFERMRAR